MRLLALTTVVLVVSVLAPSVAFAEGWSFEDYVRQKTRSEWEGFTVGTSIHLKTTQEVATPEMPEPFVHVLEQKKTLAEITETHYVLKVETLREGVWVESSEREARDRGLTSTIEGAGKGTVTVGGTTYECAKKKVTWKKGEEVEETSTLWLHPEKGLLKLEVLGEEGVFQVSKLDASFPVGGTTVRGLELEMKIKDRRGLELTGTARRSTSVPDGLVRHEMVGVDGSSKLHILIELLGFTKK